MAKIPEDVLKQLEKPAMMLNSNGACRERHVFHMTEKIKKVLTEGRGFSNWKARRSTGGNLQMKQR